MCVTILWTFRSMVHGFDLYIYIFELLLCAMFFFLFIGFCRNRFSEKFCLIDRNWFWTSWIDFENLLMIWIFMGKFSIKWRFSLLVNLDWKYDGDRQLCVNKFSAFTHLNPIRTRSNKFLSCKPKDIKSFPALVPSGLRGIY